MTNFEKRGKQPEEKSVKQKTSNKRPRSVADRIVGAASPSDEEEIAKEMENRFLTQYPAEGLPEREKTPEEIEMLKVADRGTDAVLLHYNVPSFSIPLKAIHVSEEERWKSDPDVHGIYFGRLRAIFIQPNKNRLAFFMHAFHEMIHMKSYYAVQVPTIKQNESLRDYRVGLSVRSRDANKEYFHSLNEAVTEELVKRFAKQSLAQRILRSAYEDSERQIAGANKKRAQENKPPLSDETYTFLIEEEPNSQKADGTKGYLIKSKEFVYQDERRALKRLCEKMNEKSPKEFPTPDAAFDLFAKAMLSGKLIELGRAINSLFEKNTFRRLGEAGKDPLELQKIVDSLI